jgi:hypothetical protein
LFDPQPKGSDYEKFLLAPKGDRRADNFPIAVSIFCRSPTTVTPNSSNLPPRSPQETSPSIAFSRKHPSEDRNGSFTPSGTSIDPSSGGSRALYRRQKVSSFGCFVLNNAATHNYRI